MPSLPHFTATINLALDIGSLLAALTMMAY